MKNITQEHLNKMFEENQTLVHYTIKRYYPSIYKTDEYDDYVQLGNMGLVKAIKGFDENFGTQFSTYAVPMICGEIRRYLRDNQIVRFSRRIKDVCYAIYSSYRNIPNKEDIKYEDYLMSSLDEFDLSKIEKEECIQFARKQFIALDTPIPNSKNDNLTLQDTIADDSTMHFTEEVYFNDYINEICKNSRDVEKTILYGWLKNKTQQEMADEIGISQAQVSRILRHSRYKTINLFIQSQKFDYALRGINALRNNEPFNNEEEFFNWSQSHKIIYGLIPKNYINKLIQNNKQEEETNMTTNYQFTSKKQFNVIITKAIIKIMVLCKEQKKDFDSTPKNLKERIIDVLQKAKILHNDFESYIINLNKDMLTSFINNATKYYEHYDYKYNYEIKLDDKPFEKLVNRRKELKQSIKQKKEIETSQNNNTINVTINKIIDLLQNFNRSLIVDI